MNLGPIENWAVETWTNGEFWRQILSNTVGVFLGAGLALAIERRRRRQEVADRKRGESEARARRAAQLKQVLADGVIRNLAVLRHALNLVTVDGQIPAIRFHVGHFQIATLPAAEMFEGNPDAYGRLVNAHQMLEFINHRLDQVASIELQHFLFDRQEQVREWLAPYRKELADCMRKVSGMLEGSMKDLGEESRLMELEVPVS
jgi:hypothetical protein